MPNLPPLSFPRSAWERTSATLCVAYCRGAHSANSLTGRGASRPAFPRGAWERGGETATPSCSASLASELLQRMAVRRHQAAIAAGRHGHLADVEVAVRIDADAVRGEEVAGRGGILAATPARQQLAFPVEEAHPSSRGVRRGRTRPRPHAAAEAQLGDVHVLVAVEEHLARPGQVR